MRYLWLSSGSGRSAVEVGSLASSKEVKIARALRLPAHVSVARRFLALDCGERRRAQLERASLVGHCHTFRD